MELLQELTTRMEDASKDTVWAEKLRTAADWDTCTGLLGEKGIAVPSELQGAFAANYAGKTGKLGDEELEKVSGGVDLFPFLCANKYNLWCEIICCNHLVKTDSLPQSNQCQLHCKKRGWTLIIETCFDKHGE